MFTFAIIAVVSLVLGVAIGRNPTWFAQNSGLFLTVPKKIGGWLMERIKKNPQLCAAFCSGFFAGLLVSGKLNEIIWNFVLVSLCLVVLYLFFPAIGAKCVRFVVDTSKTCFTRIKEFFA